MKLIFAALMIFQTSVVAQAMTEASVVIQPEAVARVKASTINYRFRLFDHSDGAYLTEADLVITHEKILHFIVYDKALKEFQHVHPTYDGQYWNVTLNFGASGDYKLWAQGKTSAGTEFSTSSDLSVLIDQAAWPLPPILKDVREGMDGISVAVISGNSLKAGSMAMLELTFSRNDGTDSEITPYLGAIAHVIAISANAEELAHVHPMDGSKPNEGMLHVTFPKAGFYRLWVQFMDGAVLRQVPLAVEVK